MLVRLPHLGIFQPLTEILADYPIQLEDVNSMADSAIKEIHELLLSSEILPRSNKPDGATAASQYVVVECL